MKVIKIQHPHDLQKEEFSPMVMALGYFDGVHLGHQKVIQTAKNIAADNGLKSAVMTFDPHPSVVLRQSLQHVEYITPLHEKIRLISDLDVDYLFVVHFSSEFANLLPQEFVDEYIIRLNVVHVVAGFDYSYGRMGKGTMETLPFHSREAFKHTIVPKLELHHEKISSTLIRSKIAEGKTDELPFLLGRYYTTKGKVVHGDKRGRTMGFPTANVDVFDDFLLPPVGVYSVKLFVDGSWYEGVCNVGYKPTFNEEVSKKPSVEAHLFDFDKDVYEQKVIVEWHKRLRKETKFSGVTELIEQIEKDKENALVYFKKSKSAL